MSGKFKSNPFAPASYDDAHIAAIQAIAAGNATPEQQRRGLDWIITGAAMTYQETFVPGSPDVSDHLSGRRSVGLQIIKLLKLTPGQLKKEAP